MIPTLSFIGSGNLAWHLAPALDNAGMVVREVYSLHKKNAEALTNRLYQAEVMTSLDFSKSKSNIFFICTSDDSIQSVAQDIILPDNALLIHTSGSRPLTELSYAAVSQTGVFYPLQTFSKERKIDFKDLPIFIESADRDTEKTLFKLAQEIGSKAKKIDSAQRMALHIAAIFASNFTNHMLTLSKEIADRNKLDFKMLKPLITETLSKGLGLGPDKAQTGPARRGDLEILDQHFVFLEEDESLAELYKVVTQHILDHYQPD